MTNNVILALDGLTCGHCIRRVKEALEQHPDVIQADVSLDQATITGRASPDALIAIIEQAGYQASNTQDVGRPKPEPLTASEPSPEALTVDTPAPAADNEQSWQLLIEGMSCASCVSRVENALENVDGVTQARVNLAERSALVMGCPAPQALTAAVSQAGYHAEIVEDETRRREKQRISARRLMRRYSIQAALALLTGVPLMIWGMMGDNMMLTRANHAFWLTAGLITLGIMIAAGGHFYTSAWRTLRHASATMDTLVALGTGAAWLYSMAVVLWPQAFPAQARHLYFEASAMIIGLINLGHALEQRARQRSSRALEKLLDLTPATARVITDQGEQTRPLSEVRPGMILRLVTGDRVPVDGEIREGEAWLDEAMLTGEAVPQVKSVGDTLYTGTLVQDGAVNIIARATGSHTTLARIIQLVRHAQSSKPALGRLADRISALFVPAVVIIALFSATLWLLFGPPPSLSYALVVATTVLIIACPCALGLATPMSIISGTGRAAELGILVHDADALQRACRLDTLVFDKTGTLTAGNPVVSQVETFSGYAEEQVVQWAAALEQNASHPLARAIVSHAGKIPPGTLAQFRTLRGQGVSGRFQERALLLGNSSLMQDRQIDTHRAQRSLERLAAQGATPVMLAVDGELAGVLAIRDELRPDSVSALQRLHQAGYRLIMLTGDNAITAEAIAREAGLDQVIAGVLPEGKADAIRTLQQQGQRVAMIGDGINDAPALAQADVSIAMGSGSDVAIETAGITLMRNDLHCVADALALSHATLRNIRQNLFGAFIYNSIGIPVAAGILYPLTGTLLSPVIAGAAMALSSITVVSNANRLLRFQPPGRSHS